jgi:DNA replication and repair protein RecF
VIIRTITLRDFRNVPCADLSLTGRRQFLRGANGQGKSNLLEAVGFLTALRSYRAPDSRNLIAHDRPEADLAFMVEVEDHGTERLAIKIRRDGKELWYGTTRVARLAEHVGRFPTVVFSSQDLQLIRGAPSLRRRWLDLALASMDPAYLSALQSYGRALAGRNALLKGPGAGAAGVLAAFDRSLAPAGAKIVALRAACVAELAAEFSSAYARLCDGSEAATLDYVSPLKGVSAEGILGLLEKGRARDMQMRTTLVGPHRDDLRFEVRGADAADFASEGQQRSATLALRLAQARWFHVRSRVRPVLLADDVLGELDPARRERFWAAFDPDSQVIATGTRLPDASLGAWEVFSVADGAVSPDTGAMGAAD